MSALTSSVHSRRSLPALGGVLAGGLVLMALGAAPASAIPGVATSTNPASSALGPVSKQAQPAAGATGTSASGVGSATRSDGAAVGGTAPGTVGGSGAGTAPGSGTPTTTYKPPATSPTGAGATGIQTSTATPVTGNHAPRRASSSTSTAAIALAILALLLALGAAAWGIARWQAYEPRWTVSLHHAMAEAGFRASSTWAEFTDWVRLGR
jgi:hypothetical protein